jgi:hypothetical protein
VVTWLDAGATNSTVSIQFYAAGNADVDNVTIMRPVGPVNTQGLLEFVKNSLGKNTDGYDYSAIIAGKQTKDGSEYTCASLVAEALRRAGVPLDMDKVTTPNNILNDSHLKKKCP